jgi:hypothetical protein
VPIPTHKANAAKKLTAAEVALPIFAPAADTDGTVFDFTSHRRAREALEFALGIEDLGYNVFVLGEERSGRMTATLHYLEQAMQARPAPSDWIILNNFRHPHQPQPFRLPIGTGRRFRSRMTALDHPQQFPPPASAAAFPPADRHRPPVSQPHDGAGR